MVKNSFNSFCLKKRNICITAILVFSCNLLFSQEKSYNVFYRIYFKDKGPYSINDFSAVDLLSERAIERREKAGIPFPDFRDLPVYDEYINQISSLGFKLHCTSGWMNTALFKTEVLRDIDSLMALPFVSNVKIVKSTAAKSSAADKLFFTTSRDALPPYDQPLLMLNGKSVHNSGFSGKGKLIAVLDGGFSNADNITSLNALRDRNGIAGTFDFVGNNEFVYGYHSHGTAVLSILAGYVPGVIEGSAQGAEYWLLRTEDTGSEFPVEEDFWAAAAEFADSLGVDIISSSLGYFIFDDPLSDYKYSDMDGNTAFVTLAADIAASKGILVVNSAGNERNNPWIRIIAPSDGDSVLAVGAVTWEKSISSFSSAGPSWDNRIKPDLVSQGVSVPIQVKTTTVERGNGTSFSCPLISGMAACIMEAVPLATASDIISSLYSVSDRYHYPDSLYGYGIPDIAEAINELQDKYIPKPDNLSIASPNPFNEDLKITFREVPEKLSVEFYNMNGKLLMKTDFGDYISRTLIINELRSYEPGIYFIRVQTIREKFTHKVIKIDR